MKSMWNAENVRELHTRLDRLAPDTPAQWGRMNAPQVVVHLCDAFRMASGELKCAPKSLPIRFTPLKQLIIYWMPFPKGSPTAPELLARAPGDWAVDLAALRIVMDRFASRGPGATARSHPAFGELTGRTWGVLAYRHTDHHLRQFGL